MNFLFNLDWGCYIISIAKTASMKIEVLICSMKFFSHEVAQYLYRSTICPCIEYFCHVWADAPSCYLELLDKLQKQICVTVSLALCQNVACVSTFYRYYFGWCSSELAELALEGALLAILTDCMIFLSPFLDVRRTSLSTVSFLAQLDSGILCL